MFGRKPICRTYDFDAATRRERSRVGTDHFRAADTITAAVQVNDGTMGVTTSRQNAQHAHAVEIDRLMRRIDKPGPGRNGGLHGTSAFHDLGRRRSAWPHGRKLNDRHIATQRREATAKSTPDESPFAVREAPRFFSSGMTQSPSNVIDSSTASCGR